jgi:hypothetical protein
MKFRKRPVEIEAWQYDGFQEAAFAWEATLSDVNPFTVLSFTPTTETLWVKTLEGMMKVEKGDWIIKGVKGELYPCKPDIFAATYDRVEEKPPVPAGRCQICGEAMPKGEEMLKYHGYSSRCPVPASKLLEPTRGERKES